MAPAAENISKDTLDSQLATIDAIKRDDVPTKPVRGKERPINVTSYKRKLRKQAIRVHEEKLIALAIIPLIDAGYPTATGVMQFGKLVITLETPSVVEDYNG